MEFCVLVLDITASFVFKTFEKHWICVGRNRLSWQFLFNLALTKSILCVSWSQDQHVEFLFNGYRIPSAFSIIKLWMVVSSSTLNILEPRKGICHCAIAHRERIDSWLGVYNIAEIFFLIERQMVIRQWIQSKHHFVKTDSKYIFFSRNIRTSVIYSLPLPSSQLCQI